MYLVVSRWKAKPGKEDVFENEGKGARASLRSQPGVTMVESFMTDEGAVVVHGYEDEAAYNRIVNDPNGHFAKMAAETKLEEIAEWLGSWRGNTRD